MENAKSPVTTRYIRPWGLYMIKGIASLVIGALGLMWPGITFVTLILLLGTFILVDGIYSIARALNILNKSQHWGWYTLHGLFGLVIGTLSYYDPLATGSLLIYLFAAWAFLAGILEIATAIRLRKEIRGEGWYILAGILNIIMAIFIMLNPLLGVFTIDIIFISYALITGLLLISLSMRLRKRERQSHTNLVHA